MTGKSSFDGAYSALRSDPRWQTGFHDPLTGIDDAWNRFLDWIAQVDFGAVLGALLLRILLIALLGAAIHQLVRRWPFSGEARLRPDERTSILAWTHVSEQAPPADPTTLLAEADLLATDGRHLDAISTLLKAAIAAANRWSIAAIAPAATVREIGAAQFVPGPRETFRTIGLSIERGRFAGVDIDAASYRECRAACEHLLDPRSWRA